MALRIMSFLEEATGTELVLPVTPASYHWRHLSAVETVRLDQVGEINLPGGIRMGDCTLSDVLLPAQLYPFCVPGARAAPYEYLYTLQTWCDKAAKLRWIVSGTPVNASVILEEVSQGERDGTNDLYVTIVMRQWVQPKAPALAVSGGAAQTGRDCQTGTASAKTYTVQSGDSLWRIAEQFYGQQNGSYYTRIAAANPQITNPNLIYPGQVLTIPALSDLPAARTASTSQALADSIGTVWDTVSQSWRFAG